VDRTHPVVLAFDTAGPICSAALLCQDDCRVLRSNAERRHARELLPMLSQLMDDNGVSWSEIDTLAIVHGPGSFTGLRIGSAVAQGLGFGHSLPVVTVSSLHLMAEKALVDLVLAGKEIDFVLVCVRARVGEYYYGLFRVVDNRLVLPGRESVGDHAALRDVADNADLAAARVAGVGDAFGNPDVQELASDHKFVAVYPHVSTDAVDLANLAAQMFAMGVACDAETVMPVYLKENMTYRRSDE